MLEQLNAYNLTPFQAQQKNPLALAFLGDTVWELLVRERLLLSMAKVVSLHKQAVSKVNANAQAKASLLILPHLNESEQAIFQRGVNAQPKHNPPKNQNPFDYHKATGVEALFGYLYLTNQQERLYHLFNIAMEDISSSIK